MAFDIYSSIETYEESGAEGGVTAGGTVTLKPYTAGTEIIIGGGEPASLMLNSDELDIITADTLVIGDAVSDDILIAGKVDLADNVNTLALITGGAIADAYVNSGDNDIIVNTLVMDAVSGIGTADDPIETEVSNILAKNRNSGDISIVNSGDLTILAGDPGDRGSGIINLNGDVYLTTLQYGDEPGSILDGDLKTVPSDFDVIGKNIVLTADGDIGGPGPEEEIDILEDESVELTAGGAIYAAMWLAESADFAADDYARATTDLNLSVFEFSEYSDWLCDIITDEDIQEDLSKEKSDYIRCRNFKKDSK
jgi:hypothetical protein